MSDADRFQKVFESALAGLLNNWRVWCGDDEILAMHIGFDSANTEVSVSLLTDREPYLEEDGIDPLGDRWATADWRLNCINEASENRFPDAAEVLNWMRRNAEELADEDLRSFNQQLKSMFFGVATGAEVKGRLKLFRCVSMNRAGNSGDLRV